MRAPSGWLSVNQSLEPMTTDDTPEAIARTHRILLLPGWQNSDPGHWQSLWERDHGFERVDQDEWTWPRRGDWMARLDEVLQADARPAILVAHSLGCLLVDAWAGHSAQLDRVAGALLVAPPDTLRADAPPQLHGWRRPTRGRLPFPATVLYSRDDPYASAHFAQRIADDWGATAIDCGPCGHLNTAAGLGPWPQGLQALHRLQARIAKAARAA